MMDMVVPGKRKRRIDNKREDMNECELTAEMTENRQYWKMMVKTGPHRYGDGLWAAVFTFNPYLLISINELRISIIHLLISINELLISINELLISINELLISINTSSSTVFIDINNSFIDINKGIIDINNSFVDINKYG